jgi:urease
MLGRRHVLPSVLSTLASIQIEGTFPTGTYLVTVHHPISSDDGDLEKALYGSFLPVPSMNAFTLPDPSEYEPEKAPGAVIPVKDGKITLNEGRKRVSLKVVSKGDRPIQVTRDSYLMVILLLTSMIGWIALPLHRGQPGITF